MPVLIRGVYVDFLFQKGADEFFATAFACLHECCNTQAVAEIGVGSAFKQKCGKIVAAIFKRDNQRARLVSCESIGNLGIGIGAVIKQQCSPRNTTGWSVVKEPGKGRTTIFWRKIGIRSVFQEQPDKRIVADGEAFNQGRGSTDWIAEIGIRTVIKEQRGKGWVARLDGTQQRSCLCDLCRGARLSG